MKTLGRTPVLLMLLFVSAGASAQCTNQSISHDTTVTGSGSDLYNFSFPKFDPQIGTLTDVNIETKVSLRFGYQLENPLATPVTNYKLKLECYDEINSSALTEPVSNLKIGLFGPYNFAASDGVPGSGPDYKNIAPFIVMNQQQFGATVYNTADYMGTGPVSFDFSTGSYVTIIGNASVSYTGSVQDEINFRITYNYCPVSLLASDITSFTANKTTDGNIEIRWNTQNEKTNRKYELQKSTDGRVYRDVVEFAAQASTSETGSYRYSYQTEPGENNQTLLFRLKLTEENGKEKFSATRAVKLSAGETEKPLLYPNPAKGTTTLLFSNKKRGNWEVQLLNIKGQVMKRMIVNNALSAKLDLSSGLPRGLYMVRSTNTSTKEQFVQRLLVQ